MSDNRGLGQVPATPATNPRLGPRVHQMQMLHTLAHYLASHRSFAAYAEEVTASGRPDDGAPHIPVTVTVLAEPFYGDVVGGGREAGLGATDKRAITAVEATK